MNNIVPSNSLIDNLKRYLLFRSWTKIEHPNKRIELFCFGSDDDYATLTIPISADLSDSKSLIYESINFLAAQDNIAIKTLIDRIVRWDRDILRTRFIKMLGHEDSLPLGIASDTIRGLREFMGYAAYTHSNPQPFFDKAGGISGEFSRHCLFGHTFEGSFGLTIECPVTVTPTLPIEGIEPYVPFERQVIERVANGLITLKEAVSKESIDPILGSYASGFGANMCRKLAEIYENADGRRIEYDISWSPQLRSACERSWNPILFDGKAYDIVRAAAIELERVENFPDSIVEGRIVVLKSEMPPGLDEQAEFEHTITMFWEREKSQIVKIKVPLSPQQYIDACDAHKEGRSIRIFGVPEKVGKFWSLTKAHDFVVL